MNINGTYVHIKDKLKDFLNQSKRVIKVARKPGREEYFNFAKVTGLGIILIGVIGFIIFAIAQLIKLN
jgi:protein transport protein SEC61 subunit gamma-like protein